MIVYKVQKWSSTHGWSTIGLAASKTAAMDMTNRLRMLYFLPIRLRLRNFRVEFPLPR